VGVDSGHGDWAVDQDLLLWNGAKDARHFGVTCPRAT
jgi:hypothetical protein